MSEEVPKPIPIIYPAEWDNRRQRSKFKKAKIVKYLLNGVVEAVNEKGETIKLYQSEYREA